MAPEKKKTWRYLLAGLTVALTFAVQAAAAGDKLVIAIIPSQGESTLMARYAPLVELLSRKLQKEVKFDIAENYQEIGERIHLHAADLGILGANAYVEAKEKHPEIVYLATSKHPNAQYHSLIITRKGSGIDSLAALKGKSFGYTEIQSTSGYLYPRQMLKKAGLDPDNLFNRTYFLNKHDKVYDAVAKGSIDAGGATSTVWDEAVKRNGEVYTALASSNSIPLNAVIAGSHLSPATLAEIREVLQNAEHDAAFANSGSDLKGFLIKDDSFYDVVRQERSLR